MSQAQLVQMARHNMAYAKEGKIEQAESVAEIPVEHYFSESRWRQEMD